MPSVNRLYQEYREKGLEVALISFREPPDLVARVARERGYVAPVLIDQSGDTTGRGYGVWGPPTVYVVDRNGNLVARGVGTRDWSSPAARRVIEDVLSRR